MFLNEKDNSIIDSIIDEYKKMSENNNFPIEERATYKDLYDLLFDYKKLMIKSDKYEFDEITLSLMIFIHTISMGYDSVHNLNDILIGFIKNQYDGNGLKEGETGMLNSDGTRVTLKDLGIEE